MQSDCSIRVQLFSHILVIILEALHFTSTYSKNSSAVKKGKAKKVQVTERLKDVISLWGQEEKLHQLGCVYKTSAYI